MKLLGSLFPLILLILIVALGLISPDTSVLLEGSFAWAFMVLGSFGTMLMLLVLIIGGEVSFSSVGLIPTVKKWFTRKK